MVEITKAFGKNGLQDWILQRITAIFMALYTIFLLGFLISHPTLSYSEWHSLFSNSWMRYSSFIIVLSLLAHTWIGLWTVTTDYIKPLTLRFVLQIFIIIALFSCLFWSIDILWMIK